MKAIRRTPNRTGLGDNYRRGGRIYQNGGELKRSTTPPPPPPVEGGDEGIKEEEFKRQWDFGGVQGAGTYVPIYSVFTESGAGDLIEYKVDTSDDQAVEDFKNQFVKQEKHYLTQNYKDLTEEEIEKEVEQEYAEALWEIEKNRNPELLKIKQKDGETAEEFKNRTIAADAEGFKKFLETHEGAFGCKYKIGFEGDKYGYDIGTPSAYNIQSIDELKAASILKGKEALDKKRAEDQKNLDLTKRSYHGLYNKLKSESQEFQNLNKNKQKKYIQNKGYNPTEKFSGLLPVRGREGDKISDEDLLNFDIEGYLTGSTSPEMTSGGKIRSTLTGSYR